MTSAVTDSRIPLREDKPDKPESEGGKAASASTSGQDHATPHPDDSNPLLVAKPSISVRNYMLMYVYHVVYYSTLGPGFFLLFFWIKQIRNSLMNMLFIRINPWCAFQNLYWITCAYTALLAVILRGYSLFDSALLYSTLLNTFFRSATISGKYSTYPQEEVDRIFNQLILPSQVRGEMMVDAWNRQVPLLVEQELRSLRNRERLSQKPPQLEVELKADKPGEKRSLSVDNILLDHVQAFNVQVNQKFLMIVVYCWAVIRTVACGLLNVAVGLPFHGSTTEEVILFYVMLLFQFMYFSVAPVFYLLAFKDVQRHKYLTQVSLLLMDGTEPLEGTIRRVSEITSKEGWELLIRLHRYGDRFLKRHVAFINFLLLHVFLLILLLLPKYFNLFVYSQFAASERKLQVLFLADLLFMTTGLIPILLLLANCNEMKRQLSERFKGSKNCPMQLQQENELVIPVLGFDFGYFKFATITLISLAAIGGAFAVVFTGTYKILQ